MPAVAAAGGSQLLRAHALSGRTRLQGSHVLCLGLLALLGGRQRMNGLGRRARVALGTLAQAALGCAKPVWQRPSPLKPFVAAGCSFLIPSFSPFILSSDRKPPAPPSLPGRFGKQSSLGDTLGAFLVDWGCPGVSRSQICKRTLFHSLFLVILAKPLRFSGPWCSCLYNGARWFGSDTVWLWVPKGIVLVPRMGEEEAERSPPAG